MRLIRLRDHQAYFWMSTVLSLGGCTLGTCAVCICLALFAIVLGSRFVTASIGGFGTPSSSERYGKWPIGRLSSGFGNGPLEFLCRS